MRYNSQSITVIDGVEEQLSPTAMPDLERIYGPYARLLGEAALLTDLICGPRRHLISSDLLGRLAGRYSAALKGIRHLPILSRPFVRSLVVLYHLRLERVREKWDSPATLSVVLPEQERRWHGWRLPSACGTMATSARALKAKRGCLRVGFPDLCQRYGRLTIDRNLFAPQFRMGRICHVTGRQPDSARSAAHL